jgi:hypothetical protein
MENTRRLHGGSAGVFVWWCALTRVQGKWKVSEVALLQSAAGMGADADLWSAATNGRLDDLRSALRAGANVECVRVRAFKVLAPTPPSDALTPRL